MTFPVVAARTTTADAVAAFSHSIGLGAPSAGDLLIVFATTAGGGGAYILDETVSGPGWLTINTATSSTLRLIILAKIATGGDALTLRSVNSVRMPSVCYRITGHGSTVAGGATSTAIGTNGDPPAASITGAAQDILFLTAMTTGSSVASAAPSSYATLTTASVNNSFMSCAERALNGTTDNPGVYTNTSQEWIATTIAIPELAITTAARLTQEAVEIVSDASPAARLTQIATEVISLANAAARLTQLAVEMVSENVPNDSGAGPAMLIIAT